MTRTTYDIQIIQGETFFLNLRVKNEEGLLLDLTSYTGAFQARKTYASEDAFIDSATDGTLGFDNGSASTNLTYTLSATETAALPVTKGVYELEIVNNIGTVTKVLRGTITVLPEVTR